MWDIGRRFSTWDLAAVAARGMFVGPMRRLDCVAPCRLSWSPLLVKILVASAGRPRHGISIASATWDLWTLRYLGPLSLQLVTFAMRNLVAGFVASAMGSLSF